MVWLPGLIQMFEDMKNCITSSPIMVHLDPTKPVFLKTGWSSEGMAWILMKPAGDEE